MEWLGWGETVFVVNPDRTRNNDMSGTWTAIELLIAMGPQWDHADSEAALFVLAAVCFPGRAAGTDKHTIDPYCPHQYPIVLHLSM